jgi:ABC-type sugar transport system ATPase subunit
MRGVSKRFGTTLAVCELDLEVNRAEVLALLATPKLFDMG